jgi:hypothetical protein
MGYDLFQDKDTLNSLFIAANILSHDSILDQLKGKIDTVWVGSLLHRFDWKHQVLAVKHMLKLLSPHPHSMIVGRLLGHSEPGETVVAKGTDHERPIYLHNVKSFKKMFHEACDLVDQKWQTDVEERSITSAHDQVKIKRDEKIDTPWSLEITFVATKLERVDKTLSHDYVF